MQCKLISLEEGLKDIFTKFCSGEATSIIVTSGFAQTTGQNQNFFSLKTSTKFHLNRLGSKQTNLQTD